jgi:uncharacterized protein (DUF362 family)
MDRREFLSLGLKAGAFAAAGLLMGPRTRLEAAAKIPELVAVKGGLPRDMFDAGMKAYGGMGSFVKRGQSVLVKPNIGWDVPPERAGCTNPGLVARIVEHCIDAGAKKVYVFDNSCDFWKRCYETSGIQAAVQKAGGTMVPAMREEYYQEVRIPGARVLKTAKAHETLLEADVFINVPILKHHGEAQLTVGMKNLMGVVWDRMAWHRASLNQCIADFAAFRKPSLTVVDAYDVMKSNGPRGISGADIVRMKTLLLSTDPVLADAAAAKIFGYADPSSVMYIGYADEMRVGNMRTEGREILRLSL